MTAPACTHGELIARVVALLAGLAAWPASAATLRCASPDALATLLKDEYGETLVGTGHADTEGLLGHVAMGHEASVVVYAAPDGKTWTLVIIIDGRACPLGSGDEWRAGKPGAKS